MTDKTRKIADTTIEVSDERLESAELLQTMVRSIRAVVRIALDAGKTLDLDHPDSTIDSIAKRSELDIESIRATLRTQFYLAVSIRETSQEDATFCAQKIADSNDSKAIIEAYDYAEAVEYQSPEWKILFDALVRLKEYNEAYRTLAAGSDVSIFIATKIASTKNAEKIYQAACYMEKGPEEALILASALVATKQYGEILGVFIRTDEHTSPESNSVLTDSLCHSGHPKIICEALKFCQEKGTEMSLSLARALKETGTKIYIKIALKRFRKKDPEYAILAEG